MHDFLNKILKNIKVDYNVISISEDKITQNKDEFTCANVYPCLKFSYKKLFIIDSTTPILTIEKLFSCPSMLSLILISDH